MLASRWIHKNFKNLAPHCRAMAIGSHNPYGRIQDTNLALGAKVESVQSVPNESGVQINWQDGHVTVYNNIWLRVNCPFNVHASGSRLSFPGDVLDVEPLQVTPGDGKDGIHIEWSDGHRSTFGSKWLRLHDSSVSSIIDRYQSSWPTALRSWEVIPSTSYDKVMSSDDGVYELLRNINKNGICRISKSGTALGTVEKIATRISPQSHTMLYGGIFDVLSQDNARNIAYTREKLRLHMDLAYYESPAGLQFLHCVQFDDNIVGGESCYLDGFEAAKQFSKLHPEAFNVLSSIPATFQKIRDFYNPELVPDNEAESEPLFSSDGKIIPAVPPPRGGHNSPNTAAISACYLTYQRPHIELDTDGEITGVFWAPMFEGTLHVPSKSIQSYYKAYAEFQSFIETGDFSNEYTVKYHMNEGDCMVFNNRRMLHGRESFSGDGKRHFQGCYTNIDESLSRYIVLRNSHKYDISESNVTRWGNGSIPLAMHGL